MTVRTRRIWRPQMTYSSLVALLLTLSPAAFAQPYSHTWAVTYGSDSLGCGQRPSPLPMCASSKADW
jgi:hypothetical protein